MILILMMVFMTTLAACTPDEETTKYIVLPDLNGQTEADIIALFDDLGLALDIEYHDTQSKTYELQFIMYPDHNIGDIVPSTETIRVLIYPTYVSDTMIELPQLTGLREDDIRSMLLGTGIVYYMNYVTTEDESLHGLFAGYVDGHQAGDQYDNISAIGILIHRYGEELTDEYFQVLDLVYDGPYLDPSVIGTEYMSPRGGAFEVTLLSCTDGDTSRFVYPTDIYDAIRSSAKSTRFLNMDTEETYRGGEEEWGKPASVYTCSLLESATSIVLQTDPGDGLLDTHGRLLAWIWVQLPDTNDYQLLNYMVVRQGLAQVKYEFGAGEDLSYGDYTYNEWMHNAEDLAIEEALGQWSNLRDYYWNYDEDQPYYDRWD
jgi:endonuclease YncB( thermonuclease family)